MSCKSRIRSWPEKRKEAESYSSTEGPWSVMISRGLRSASGCLMGMALCNVPAIYVDAGTIKPGKWKGQDLTVVSAFEAVGAFSAGRIWLELALARIRQRNPISHRPPPPRVKTSRGSSGTLVRVSASAGHNSPLTPWRPRLPRSASAFSTRR